MLTISFYIINCNSQFKTSKIWQRDKILHILGDSRIATFQLISRCTASISESPSILSNSGLLNSKKMSSFRDIFKLK